MIFTCKFSHTCRWIQAMTDERPWSISSRKHTVTYFYVHSYRFAAGLGATPTRLRAYYDVLSNRSGVPLCNNRFQKKKWFVFTRANSRFLRTHDAVAVLMIPPCVLLSFTAVFVEFRRRFAPFRNKSDWIVRSVFCLLQYFKKASAHPTLLFACRRRMVHITSSVVVSGGLVVPPPLFKMFSSPVAAYIQYCF